MTSRDSDSLRHCDVIIHSFCNFHWSTQLTLGTIYRIFIGIIFTKPDQHAGRGLNLKQSEVKKCALENNIKTFQPKNSKELESYLLKNYDLLLVVAYGFLLTPKILAQPKFGCINIHTSLLPRWRGAAPIQRAIEYGDKMTGVSFMQMEKSMDTGPIFCLLYTSDAADE